MVFDNNNNQNYSVKNLNSNDDNNNKHLVDNDGINNIKKEHNLEKVNFYLKIIFAIFIIFLIIVSFIPYYTIHVEENPKNIPGINDKFISNLRLLSIKQVSQNDYKNDYKANRTYSNLQTLLRYKKTEYPILKQVSSYVVEKSCKHYDKLCYAKALFYFIKNNFHYVNDPYNKDYFATPVQTFVTGAGDCDDFSSLLANMLYEVGIDSRYVLIPGHIFVEAYFPDSPKRYQLRKDGFITLDPTCQYCDFGSIPSVNKNKKFIYLY